LTEAPGKQGQVRAELYFKGEVQGVGFRFITRRAALRLGLKGFVENLEDGQVRVVCEGPRPLIEELVESLKRAPPPVRVEEVKAEFKRPTGEFKVFKLILGDPVEEIAEGFSTGVSHFGVMFGRQDQALSKMDQMLERQDRMLEKQDQALSLQRETLNEVRALRQDLRSILDERLARVEQDLARIKAHLGLG
jgi:acylphosphatase